MVKTTKAEMTDRQYAELADRLTDPAHPIPSGGEAKSGAEAAAQGRALMTREYGSELELERVLRRAGRPRVGQAPKGSSPTVRGRISDAEYVAFKKLSDATGRTQSELVREAVHELLARHKLVS